MSGLQLDSKIKYSALLVFLLTAWFSIGHHHSDEYFQILEFAQYKLGHINASDLPWEFHEQMRPSLQPWIAFVSIKLLSNLGVLNPFAIATIFRLISALLLWFVIFKLNRLITTKYFPDKMWSSLFYFAAYLLWFVPYMSVRFSSENFAQLFLLLGLFFFLNESRSYGKLFAIGALFGLSVLFRYQMGIVVLGIFIWMLFKANYGFYRLAFVYCSFLMVIFFGIYLDFLFYNEFVFTAFNYLKLNLIEGKASDFGTSPWWYYLVTFLGAAAPPISIVLLASFIGGSLKLKNTVFVWSIIPFILIHFLIAHKELRFLFPVSYLFIYISIYGLMEYFKNRKIKQWHRRLFRTSIGINILLLFFMMFRPAHEMVANYKYLYDHIDLGNRTILTIQKDNYKLLAGLKSTFYTPDSYFSDHVESEENLSQYLMENKIDTCFFVYGKFDFNGSLKGYESSKVYSVYPEWLKSIKWIDWQKTLKTHSIYLLTRKEGK